MFKFQDQQSLILLFAAFHGNMTTLYRYLKEGVNFGHPDYDGRNGSSSGCLRKLVLIFARDTVSLLFAEVSLLFAEVSLIFCEGY